MQNWNEPEFTSHPFVSLIANTPRWTISDNTKMPIDIVSLLATGELYGARDPRTDCLTLPALDQAIPNATNHAFRLHTPTDGFLVLDIEKTCPPPLARELLQLPGMLLERSMSGRGYHLVLPLPDNFWSFPAAATKTVLKGPGGWYEILLDHWVTFTGSILDLPTPLRNDASDLDARQRWSALYAQLAQDAEETLRSEIEVELDKPEILNEQTIISQMIGRPLRKSLDDFDGDFSRYEFSTLSALYGRMRQTLSLFRTAYPLSAYGDTERVWLLYQAAEMYLEHRDKHDTVRNGQPYLFEQALRMVSMKTAEEEQNASRGTTP